MNDPQLSDTLNALRAQRSSAERRVATARHELADAEIVLARLVGAIDSLELLLSPVTEVQDAVAAVDNPVDNPVGFDSGAANTIDALGGKMSREHLVPRSVVPRSAAPSAIAPYTSQSGGKRLKSKMMVFDLLKRLDKPVSRDRLVQEFYSFYGLEDLKEYWARPDNALNTAIDRSRNEGLILELKDPIGGHAIYTPASEASRTSRPATLDEEDD